jgi:uncharacterized protein
VSKLHVAADFALPAEAVTQTFCILAKRGVGKTYTASVMAEEMLKASQPVVCIDPVGAMWGLRSGFPVVILGGEHADVPLEESAGEVVARAVVEHRFSAVIDLSLFRKGQMFRFMVAFAETLYRLNREALHLFVDEADQFAPQDRKYGGPENVLLGAMEDIVRRGRKRGIGCTLVTQRPAALNANVRTQCEVLVALRMLHPLDIKAVMDWVNVHADPATAKQMIDSLPSLPVGTAWFWSPGWGDFFRRVEVRRRETFDSGATPKPGEAAKRPKSLAPIDVNALGDQIKATVEKAKADDPRELRKKIADLERQLRERPAATVEVERVVEVPVLKNGQLDRTEGIIGRLETVAEKALTEAGELRRSIAPAAAPRPAVSIPKSTPAAVKQAPAATPRPNVPMASSTAAAPPAGARGVADGEPLSGPEQRILDALAWLESIGVSAPDLAATAFLAGYRTGGGAFNNPRGRLRSRGLVDYLSGGKMVLTDAGRQAANVPDAPLTADEMHRRVLNRLPGPEQKILQVLIDVYPNDLGRDELAERSGYSEGGGAFNNPCGRLRTLGLIDYPSKGRAVALPLLFVGH